MDAARDGLLGVPDGILGCVMYCARALWQRRQAHSKRNARQRLVESRDQGQRPRVCLEIRETGERNLEVGLNFCSGTGVAAIIHWPCFESSPRFGFKCACFVVHGVYPTHPTQVQPRQDGVRRRR